MAEAKREWYECVVCYELIIGEFWSCDWVGAAYGRPGHGVCGGCRGAMLKVLTEIACPICRRAVKRQTGDEEDADALIWRCDYEGRGCRARMWHDEHKAHVDVCAFRDVECPVIGCHEMFPPGDFKKHILLHDVDEVPFDDAFGIMSGPDAPGGVICESKRVPGVFVWAAMPESVMVVALVDTQSREWPESTYIIAGRDKLKMGVNSIHCVGDELKSISFSGESWREGCTINEFFGDFVVGDTWEVSSNVVCGKGVITRILADTLHFEDEDKTSYFTEMNSGVMVRRIAPPLRE